MPLDKGSRLTALPKARLVFEIIVPGLTQGLYHGRLRGRIGVAKVVSPEDGLLPAGDGCAGGGG